MTDRRKRWTASRIANVSLLTAGLIVGPMVTVDDAGSFADALILALAFAGLNVLVTGFFSMLLKQPMHRPTMDAPLYQYGQFIQQSFMAGLILCAMALGAMSYTMITGAGQGWRLFAAIGAGCLLGCMVSTWLFSSRGTVER